MDHYYLIPFINHPPFVLLIYYVLPTKTVRPVLKEGSKTLQLNINYGTEVFYELDPIENSFFFINGNEIEKNLTFKVLLVVKQ